MKQLGRRRVAMLRRRHRVLVNGPTAPLHRRADTRVFAPIGSTRIISRPWSAPRRRSCSTSRVRRGDPSGTRQRLAYVSVLRSALSWVGFTHVPVRPVGLAYRPGVLADQPDPSARAATTCTRRPRGGAPADRAQGELRDHGGPTRPDRSGHHASVQCLNHHLSSPASACSRRWGCERRRRARRSAPASRASGSGRTSASAANR